MKVIKRNNRGKVDFDLDNIILAIAKAQGRTVSNNDNLPLEIATRVEEELIEEGTLEISVDELHTLVENELMNQKAFDIAREYISYRKTHMPDIFRPRDTYRPYEYPEVIGYVDAIHKSFWTVDEFQFNSDIGDYRSKMSPEEKEATRRMVLAIATIEVKVKNFWGKLADRLPKAEIAEVGAVFASNEVVHSHAYSKILSLLGLNEDFAEVAKVPAIKKRLAYLDKSMSSSTTDQEYMETILLFTLFVENVSLFSQFLTLSTINKDKQYLNGVTAVINATNLEEQIHGKFGSYLINTMRNENPSWFDSDLDDRIQTLVQEAFEAERQIIEWFFEEGEVTSISKKEVIEYTKKRFNSGLVDAGFKEHFVVDAELLESTEWFDVQNITTTHSDFFVRRPANYSKGKNFDPNDII